jgi:[ribosomal protein S5]-alanine N-acetyltransferase
MASVPTLPGFVLSPVQLSDADEWSEFEVLPQFREHTSSAVQSAADLIPLIGRSLSPDPSAPVYFIVRELKTNRLVASVGFHSVSALNRTAEVTYGIHPSMWGHGLATALCTAAVQWGFSARSWVRIQATTLESNLASQRVLGKAGFALEGKLRNFRIVRGVPRDYLLFSIIPAAPAT